MTTKDEFKSFCERNEVSLFGSYWWWENVVKENWEVLLHKKGDQILACMPYHYKTKAGIKAIIPPMLTPYQSISYSQSNEGKLDKQISFIRKSQEELLNQLPGNSLFLRQFDYTESYLLPFYWDNFDIRVRYTYLLDTTKNEDELFSNLKDTLRKEINKIRTRGNIQFAADVTNLYDLKIQNAKIFKEPLSYSKAYLERIAELSKNGNAQIQEIELDGVIVASLLVCWDNNQLYYTCGALHPEYRTSGALSWLLWEAILKAKELNLTMNFEGSMIKSIERYFANFGANPTPFFEVKKISTKLLKPFLRKI